jgi:phosphotransferase system IIB component
MIILDQLKDDANAFLKNYGWIIAVTLVVIIAVVVVIILVKGRKVKKPVPQIAEKSKWVEALGGAENIVSSEAYGSRLAVSLVDKSLMNKEALKELGVTNFIEMSNKITLLLEDKAELVKAELDKKD